MAVRLWGIDDFDYEIIVGEFSEVEARAKKLFDQGWMYVSSMETVTGEKENLVSQSMIRFKDPKVKDIQKGEYVEALRKIGVLAYNLASSHNDGQTVRIMMRIWDLAQAALGSQP